MDITKFDDSTPAVHQPNFKKGVPAIPNLDTLREELNKAFSDDHVDVDYVKQLFANYKSNPAEWKQFAKRDPHRYTRNLVDAGNGKYNLMLLCWNEGQGSAIHDHADAHCFVKTLEGCLHEELYDWPSEEQTDKTMLPREVNTFPHNAVAYINDTVGLHRVENKSHTEPACSLHLYIPPFNECQSFDQRSGKRQTVKVTFYSEFGRRTPFGKDIKRSLRRLESTIWGEDEVPPTTTQIEDN